MTPEDLFFPLPAPDSRRLAALTGFCEVHRPQALAALPWAAAELAGNDGFRAMLLFVTRWSGLRLYVPRELNRFTAKAGVPAITISQGGGATVTTGVTSLSIGTDGAGNVVHLAGIEG